MADWAIFTGDIVKSTEMARAELEAVFEQLIEAATRIEGWQEAPARFTRFRGDGWQMATRPAMAFRAALTLRAALRQKAKHIDTRIGIGIGAANLSGVDLSAADGPALVASGHALDAMPRRRRLSAPEASPALRAALPLADRICTGWTPRQAEVAYYLLSPSPPSQSHVAEHLGLTQQSIQRHATAAGVDDLADVCKVLEQKGVTA